jgi:uncharacterized repeat protein (TIGR03803 family)
MEGRLRASVSYAALLAALALPPVSAVAAAPTETVIYNFLGPYVQPPDGSNPSGNVLLDKTGQLYGTMDAGGAGGCISISIFSTSLVVGCGTAFRLTPPASGSAWSETALYSFPIAPDGASPSPNALTYAGAISGQLYDGASPLAGTAVNGGANGHGYVFELVRPATGWAKKNLYSFRGGSTDGVHPAAGMLMPNSSTLFGTTYQGGASDKGTVFELTYNASTKTWSEQVIYNFAGPPSDGAYPASALLIDETGRLYGTTQSGGSGGAQDASCTISGHHGCGTVFRLTPPTSGTMWSETWLYSFQPDGPVRPNDLTYFGADVGELYDGSSPLYGTSSYGGTSHLGTAFALVPPASGKTGGTETTIWSFGGTHDGFRPAAGLWPSEVKGKPGALFGTTPSGGINFCNIASDTSLTAGVMFRLTPPAKGTTWSETILHDFGSGNDGCFPSSGVTRARATGKFYGTTSYGGGVVYEITP